MKSILALSVSILIVGGFAAVRLSMQPASARAETQTQAYPNQEPAVLRALEDVSVTQAGGFWLGWAMPMNISQGAPPLSIHPALGVAADGQTLYLAWTDGRATPRDIYHATSTDGGRNWETARPVVATLKDSWRPSLVVSGTTPFIAWAETKTARAREIYQGELESLVLGTSSPVTVPNEHPELAIAPRLALGPGGELHLTVQGGSTGVRTDILYSRRDIGETAWPTTTVVFTSTKTGSRYPALTVSADGQTVNLVWQEIYDDDGNSKIYYLRGQRSGEDTLWESPVLLSEGITNSIRPAIVLREETVYVAWGEKLSEGQYVRHIRSEDGGASWNESNRVNPQTIRLNSISPTDVAPALAVAPSGAVCVAWHGFRPGDNPYEEIYLTCSADQGQNWGTAVNVSRSELIISIRPALAIGSDDILHLAWQELEGISPLQDQYQVYYSRSLPYAVMLPIIRR